MCLEELAIGDYVKIYEKGTRKRDKVITGYFLVCAGKVADLQEKYILVDTGNYRTRFDIIEFRTRRYRLLKTSGEEIVFDPLPDMKVIEKANRVKKAEEKYMKSEVQEGEDDMGKPKIMREELLQYVKEYGTDKRAIRDIAKKVGLQAGTISFYLYNWGILQQLKNEQEAAKDPAPAEEAKEEKDKGLPEPEPVPADLSRIEDEEQLARDREAVKEVTAAAETEEAGAITYDSSVKGQEKPYQEYPMPEQKIEPVIRTQIDGPHVCAYKGCTTLINTGVFCAKHQAIIPVAAAAVTPVQRRILRPVNMMGEVTGCTYIFAEDSFRIDGEARFKYEDIDGLIEELQAIKNMRSA